MRMKYMLEKMEMDDQIIAVPVGENSEEFHGIIRLNETAAKIIDLLQHDVSEEDIVSALVKEYEVPEKALAEDVKNCIAYFESKGLLA